MSPINTIMSKLLRIFPIYDFEELEKEHNGNHYTKNFAGWQQLIVLLFAQIDGKDSLKEIETSLNVHHSKSYHIGLKGIKRSILSDAMNKRSCKIFEEVFTSCLKSVNR